MNYEPLYRNKERLYNQFVIQGKECVEITKENNWTARVVQKWVQEKNGWRNHTRRDEVKPTDKQLQIIYGGIPNELDVIQRKIFRNGDTDVE